MFRPKVHVAMDETYTVESHNYAPCMLALGKTREGLVCRIVIFICDNHYLPTNAMWVHDLRTFSGCLMGKTQEKQPSHNMT